MAVEVKGGEIRSTIRHFQFGDAGAVKAIAGDSPQAARWDTASYRELTHTEGALALVSEGAGKVTGFIIGRQVANEGEVLNLAVTPAKRCSGEGGALLRAALDEFQSRGVSRVFLEVRESNGAGMAFYAKHGFARTGRRPGYYRDPEEAAIVMELKLTG